MSHSFRSINGDISSPRKVNAIRYAKERNSDAQKRKREIEREREREREKAKERERARKSENGARSSDVQPRCVGGNEDTLLIFFLQHRSRSGSFGLKLEKRLRKENGPGLLV